MKDTASKWLWILDENPIDAALEVERCEEQPSGHATSDPSMLIAVHLYTRGAAQEALRELESLPPSNLDGCLLRGQILFERERYEEAAGIYGSAAEEYPHHSFARLNQGIAFTRLGKWRAAAASLKQAVIIDPDQPRAWFALGVCLLNERYPEDARGCFARSLELRPRYAPALLGEAAALHLTGRPGEALVIYEQMLEAEPGRAELLINAVAAAVAASERSKAGLFAKRLLDVRPGCPVGLQALFSIAADAGNLTEAVQWRQRLSETDPVSFDDRYDLGVCYQRLGDYERGAEAFEEALRLLPGDAEASLGLASCLVEMGAIDRAREAFQNLVKLVPERDDLLFRLGLLQYQCGEPQLAASSFEECVQRRGDWRDAWANLGASRWAAGEFEKSAAAYRRVLDLDPDSAVARRALAIYAIDAGNASLADGYHRRLPADWDVSYNLGCLHQSQGSLESAAALYRAAIDGKQEFGEAWLNLGNVLFVLGEVESSRQCWRTALAQKPELASQFLAG